MQSLIYPILNPNPYHSCPIFDSPIIFNSNSFSSPSRKASELSSYQSPKTEKNKPSTSLLQQSPDIKGDKPLPPLHSNNSDPNPISSPTRNKSNQPLFPLAQESLGLDITGLSRQSPSISTSATTPSRPNFKPVGWEMAFTTSAQQSQTGRQAWGGAPPSSTSTTTTTTSSQNSNPNNNNNNDQQESLENESVGNENELNEGQQGGNNNNNGGQQNLGHNSTGSGPLDSITLGQLRNLVSFQKQKVSICHWIRG